jgi:hypothetical protein
VDGKCDVVGLDRDLGVGSIAFLVEFLDGRIPIQGSVVCGVAIESNDVQNTKVGREADRRFSLKIGNHLGIKRDAAMKYEEPNQSTNIPSE